MDRKNGARGEKSYSRPENADAAGRMENKMPRKIVRYPIYDNARDLPLIDLRTCVCIRQASIRADRMSYGRLDMGDKGEGKREKSAGTGR